MSDLTEAFKRVQSDRDDAEEKLLRLSVSLEGKSSALEIKSKE